MYSVDDLNKRAAGSFPAYLGITFTRGDATGVSAECPVRQELMAPNGYLHAGAVVSLADTCAGFACFSNLPDGASGFTTAELKSNFLGTTREGTIACTATFAHKGRSTHVIDATVTHVESGRTLALFRCTQLILYPKA